MKTITTCLILAFLFSQIKAQEQPNIRTHLKGFTIVFPGIEAAVEFPLASWKLGKEKGSNLVLVAAPVLDFFSYRGNYNGLGLMAEINPKLKLSSGWTHELYGGVGVLNAFLTGTTFELQSDGTFSERSAKLNQYFSLKFGFGFGKSIQIRGKVYLLGIRIGAREIRTPGYQITPEASIGLIIPLKSKDTEL